MFSDGSHKFDHDTVFFNFPSILDPKRSFYGISVYRQIPVEKLKTITPEITRTTVQKSVCVLMTEPLYGYVEVKLALIADTFFEEGDFENTDILVKVYHQLNACLSESLTDPMDMLSSRVTVGLNLREHFLKWRHKLLVLFKLYLLRKRVIFFSSPVRSSCSLILAIASLFPGMLAQRFHEAFCVEASQLENSTSQADREVRAITPENRRASGELVRDSSIDSLASVMAPYAGLDKLIPPVAIFQNGNLCLPYISLPYLDLLQDPSVHSYVVGASNILFKQKRGLADVLIDTETTLIEIADIELKKLLQLSTEDRRFIDYLLKHVQSPKEGAEGSEQWIRDQFSCYLLAMLRTSLCTGGSKELEMFNGHFMSILRRSDAYDEWFLDAHASDNFKEFKASPAGHPFSGNLSVTDMKLRLSQSMHNNERGRKLNAAVNNTTQAVNQALSSARSTFSSWLTSMAPTPPEELSQDALTEIGQCGHESADGHDILQENESNNIKDIEEDLTEIIKRTADKVLELTKQEEESAKNGIFTV